MTEKSYGGNNGVREHLGKTIKGKLSKTNKIRSKSNSVTTPTVSSDSNSETDDYIKAGKIAIKVRDYAKEIIKKDMLLLDIAKKIEDKIYELGGVPAFPVNLSIDDVAAHYHPTLEDQTKATGLLKVDLGIHINGCIADTAFSMDLTEDKRYSGLIKASEEALTNALELLLSKPNSALNNIGEEIQKTIEKKGFSPIINLSGHGLSDYKIHSGITIPNYANGNLHTLEPGAYAIEPFATTGEGKVFDGPSSNIYAIVNVKTPRGPTARKILELVGEKYKTLPFSLREMQEKLGNMARLGLRELEQLGIAHNFPQLIEKSHKPVSQAEHTIIKTKDGKIIITTR